MATGTPPPSPSSTRAASAITPPPTFRVPTKLGRALVERQRYDPGGHLRAAHVDGHLALLSHLRRQERHGDPTVERGRIVAARHATDRLPPGRHRLICSRAG